MTLSDKQAYREKLIEIIPAAFPTTTWPDGSTDYEDVIDELLALLSQVERDSRKEELEAHAAVTKGITDAEECMKLLASHYFERMKQLQSLEPGREATNG